MSTTTWHIKKVTVNKVTEDRVYFKDGSWHRKQTAKVSYYENFRLAHIHLLSKLNIDTEKQIKRLSAIQASLEKAKNLNEGDL